MADVVGYEETPEGGIKAIPGKLYYRGYDVEDLVKGKQDSHFGYEEICFLLLFGYLPKKAELEHFRNILTDCYEIPDEFVEMNLLRMPGKNLMNKLQDAVLTLYNYDDDPDNIDVYETLVKGINLMAKLHLLPAMHIRARYIITTGTACLFIMQTRIIPLQKIS